MMLYLYRVCAFDLFPPFPLPKEVEKPLTLIRLNLSFEDPCGIDAVIYIRACIRPGGLSLTDKEITFSFPNYMKIKNRYIMGALSFSLQ